MKHQALEKIITTTKEEKIRQILMNEDPDFATAEKELNFLSNIAEVRSLGFDRFRYQIINKNNPGNNSTMNMVGQPNNNNSQLHSINQRAYNNNQSSINVINNSKRTPIH